MGGNTRPLSGLFPSAFRELSATIRVLILVGFVVLIVFVVVAVLAPPAEAGAWVRAELTFAAALALALGRLSMRGTTGRVRLVRSWLTLGLGLWLLGELVRNLELAVGLDLPIGLSDFTLLGVMVSGGRAYTAALSGRLRRGEELTVYLDGAIVFFAIAALVVTTS